MDRRGFSKQVRSGFGPNGWDRTVPPITHADHCSDETRAFWTTPPGAERLGPPHWLLLAAGTNSFCDCRTLAATGAGARALPNKLSAELQPFGEELGRSPILTPRIRVTQ